jgi:hypothetical protein
MLRRIALLVVVLFAVPCTTFAETPAPLRLLFVGNSLTYANDLPAMVARLGALDGRRLETRTVAEPNFSLDDHLRSGAFRKLLREKWDFVVLQQGPSSLRSSGDELVRDTKAIAALLPGPRPRIALLMVWPPRSRSKYWDGVIASYSRAASAVDGLQIPAGIRLRQLVQDDPALPLLGEDGFHPAVAGTYLAALVTYHAFTGRLPAGCDDPAVAGKIAGMPLRLSREQLGAVVRAVMRP